MVPKKSGGKQTARAGLSLASRLLSRAVPGAARVPRAEEPWRNKTPKGKSRGKRRK
jgi:hypothetical protein